MPSLIVRLRDGVVPIMLAFWRWWIGELAALRPSRLALPFAGQAPGAEVRPLRDRVEIVRIAGNEGERLSEPTPVDRFEEENWRDLATLIAGHRARVVLVPPIVHVLTLTLPKVARSRLASALPLQLRDHAPLRPELLDWAVHDVEPLDRQRIRVQVVIVRRTLLETIERGFRGQNASVPPVAAEIDGKVCVLRQASGRDAVLSAASRPWVIAAAILLATPVLALILLSILCAVERSHVDALDLAVRPQRAAEQRLRDGAAIGRSLRTLIERPTVTAIVEDLAARLPQTASARRIAIDTRDDVTFTVHAADPDSVDKLLMRDPVLTEVRRVGQPHDSGSDTPTDYAATTW